MKTDIKINLVIGSLLVRFDIYDYVLILESERKEFRFHIPLSVNHELSKPYLPFFHRIFNFDDLVNLRDELTVFIDNIEKEIDK